MTALQLSEAEQRFLDRPEVPESIRERLAAEFAAEDSTALLNPLDDVGEHWDYVQVEAPWRADYYRRLADRAIRILTESALR